MKKVYICAPLAGDVQGNLEKAPSKVNFTTASPSAFSGVKTVSAVTSLSPTLNGLPAALSREGIELAAHANIEDPAQTVKVTVTGPRIGTKATIDSRPS